MTPLWGGGSKTQPPCAHVCSVCIIKASMLCIWNVFHLVRFHAPQFLFSLLYCVRRAIFLPTSPKDFSIKFFGSVSDLGSRIKITFPIPPDKFSVIHIFHMEIQKSAQLLRILRIFPNPPLNFSIFFTKLSVWHIFPYSWTPISLGRLSVVFAFSDSLSRYIRSIRGFIAEKQHGGLRAWKANREGANRAGHFRANWRACRSLLWCTDGTLAHPLRYRTRHRSHACLPLFFS